MKGPRGFLHKGGDLKVSLVEAKLFVETYPTLSIKPHRGGLSYLHTSHPNGEHIFSNLHSDRFRGRWPAKFDLGAESRGTAQIHHRNCPKRGQKMLSIFCMPDHTHILIGLTHPMAISDLVRDIKAGSSKFINDNRWVRGRFNWQEGFGAFSYSRSQIDVVIKYILNQEKQHAKKTFRNEYIEFLEKFDVDYDEKYLFTFNDELIGI